MEQLHLCFLNAKRLYRIFASEVEHAAKNEEFAYQITLRREISKITSNLLLCNHSFTNKRKRKVCHLMRRYYSLLSDLPFDTS
jgi:hypothetical protein